MRLFWTPTARKDRREIVRYISSNDPQAALKIDETFRNRANGLILYPEMGRPGRLSGTRELVVHHRYLLVYDIRPGMVRILRALHTARHWPPSED